MSARKQDIVARLRNEHDDQGFPYQWAEEAADEITRLHAEREAEPVGYVGRIDAKRLGYLKLSGIENGLDVIHNVSVHTKPQKKGSPLYAAPPEPGDDYEGELDDPELMAALHKGMAYDGPLRTLAPEPEPQETDHE